MTRDLLRVVLLAGVFTIAVTGCAANDRTGADTGAAGTSIPAAINLQSDSTPDATLTAGPNGNIAFMRVVDGLGNIFVADSMGRNERRLTHGAWDYSPRWSPDGKYVAYSSEINGNDVYVVAVDSAQERVLVSTPAREEIIGWLPDNSGVVYLKIGAIAELWVAKLDGTTERLLDEKASVNGMVSPDGKLVGYSRLEKGRTTLWLHDLAAKSSRQLTKEGYEFVATPCCAWSPDSRKLVYTSTRSGTSDVWSIDVATGATRQLTRDVREDFRPLYSPDGRWVSFLSQRGGQLDAWVVADTGGEPVRITDSRESEERADWARDSRSLLIITQMGRTNLFRTTVDGGVPTRLVNDETEQVSWSITPDGSRIAFTSSDGVNFDVRTMATAGGKSTLVAGGPADEFLPAISPDGKQVAFISNRGGNPDLYIAPASGDSARRLLDWTSSESVPDWSPDGAWIAFVSTRASDGDIWLLHPDGTGVRRLTTNTATGSLHWSNDSRFISYTSTDTDGQSVYVVDVASGAQRVIAAGNYSSGVFWPGDSLLSVTRLEKGMAFIELRRARDGSLLKQLSPAKAKVYESFGVPTRDSRMYLMNQAAFKANDYPLAVRAVDDTITRVLTDMRGGLSGARWLADDRTIVFSFRGDIPRMTRHPFAPR